MSLDDEIRLAQSTIQKLRPIIDATLRQQATLSILSDAAARAAPDYSALTSTMAEVVEKNQPRLQQEVARLLSSMEDMQPHLSTQALSGMTSAMDMSTVAEAIEKNQPRFQLETASLLKTMEEMQPQFTVQALSVFDAVEKMRPQLDRSIFNVLETVEEMRPQVDIGIEILKAAEDIRPQLDVHVFDVLKMGEEWRAQFDLYVFDVLKTVEETQPQLSVHVFDISSRGPIQTADVIETAGAPRRHQEPPAETWDPAHAQPGRLVVVVSDRYQQYREYREQLDQLAVMGYAVLSLLEASTGDRASAARKYGVSRSVLENLGFLCTEIGDHRSARKFAPGIIPRTHTVEERIWIERVIEAIIGNLHKLASSSSGLPKHITMGDLPRLS